MTCPRYLAMRWWIQASNSDLTPIPMNFLPLYKLLILFLRSMIILKEVRLIIMKTPNNKDGLYKNTVLHYDKWSILQSDNLLICGKIWSVYTPKFYSQWNKFPFKNYFWKRIPKAMQPGISTPCRNWHSKKSRPASQDLGSAQDA